MQVRIVAPTIGLAKGMLLKKKGIDKIQLPQSMIKVGPSQTCKDPWAAVIIKNVFPSEGKQKVNSKEVTTTFPLFASSYCETS